MLYVALTRAKNELIITRQNLYSWAKDQLDAQGRPVCSYFFNDLPTALCDHHSHHRTRLRQKSWKFEEEAMASPKIGIDWS